MRLEHGGHILLSPPGSACPNPGFTPDFFWCLDLMLSAPGIAALHGTWDACLQLWVSVLRLGQVVLDNGL
jgi:hypothetical protein